MYPFIKTKYAEAQALQTPSQIYYFLRKHFNYNKQKALQWFVHALCCLKSSRGTYLVGGACQKRYEITLPGPPKADDIDAELKFYECLAKICDKAQGAELEGKLKEEFSKKGILDTNPQHLSHLPQMFFQLIQREELGPNKTKRLIRTLEKHCQSEDDAVTRWCQFYLNKYLKSAGMPQISSMQGVTRGQWCRH
ncbi:MAG: hypothetical protein MJE68_16135 [Proteobacteria bacterium]|nr:hypothetical protein [Pseudomonadota bacterium]